MLNFLLPFLRNAAVVEPDSVARQAWSFDAAHTHIGFSVRHLGLTRTPGTFRRFDAQLAFDDTCVEASRVSFEIDAASIDTAFDLRDEHLRGTDWLHVHAHPKIVFVSRSVRLLDGRQYAIDGDLTIRGITLPALSNTFISPFKDTSIASVISVPELTYGAQWINFNTFRIVEVYLVTTAMYLVTGYALLFALRLVERRFRAAR